MVTTAKSQEETERRQCQKSDIAIQDALDVLHGRWKLSIIHSILVEPKRFKQISRELNGITDKMLSKELKDLEMNQLIKRSVYDTFPPTVEYSITDHGRSLENLIIELERWGMEHRKKIIGH